MQIYDTVWLIFSNRKCITSLYYCYYYYNYLKNGSVTLYLSHMQSTFAFLLLFVFTQLRGFFPLPIFNAYIVFTSSVAMVTVSSVTRLNPCRCSSVCILCFVWIFGLYQGVVIHVCSYILEIKMFLLRPPSTQSSCPWRTTAA